MAKHLLSAREVQTAGIGDHQDGDGLFLRVQSGLDRSRASWVLRYTAPGGKRRRESGLGGASHSSIEAAGASLKRARKKADEARDLLDKGTDPVEAKRARKVAAREKAAEEKCAKKSEATTLRRYARTYHEQHVEPLLVDRHAKEWIAAIERHLRYFGAARARTTFTNAPRICRISDGSSLRPSAPAVLAISLRSYSGGTL